MSAATTILRTGCGTLQDRGGAVAAHQHRPCLCARLRTGVRFDAMPLIEGRSLVSVIQEQRTAAEEGATAATSASPRSHRATMTMANSGIRTSQRSTRTSDSCRSAARLAAKRLLSVRSGSCIAAAVVGLGERPAVWKAAVGRV